MRGTLDAILKRFVCVGRLTVRWPDGTVQDLGELKAGAWKVRKGEPPAPLRSRR